MKQEDSFYMNCKPLLEANLPCFVGPRNENPTFITIHETWIEGQICQKPKMYNAEYYINQLRNPQLTSDGTLSTTGYHYLVEANKGQNSPIVYYLIPDDIITHHCGSFGNKVSIGIERLVNEETDHEKSVVIQAELTAKLMFKYNIPLENVVPHKYWNPDKNCPGCLLAGLYGGWDGFIEKVAYYFGLRGEKC